MNEFDLNSATEAEQIAAVKKYSRNIEYIKHPSKTVQLAAVNHDSHAIMFIKDPIDAAQLIAIRKSGYLIKHLKNPSPLLWTDEQVKVSIMQHLLKMIKLSGYEIDKDLAYGVGDYLLLLNRNGCRWPELDTIRTWISGNTEHRRIFEVVSHFNTERDRLEAVSRNAMLIKFMPRPSEAVQLAAMRQNGYALQFIKFPSSAVMLAAINNDPNAIEFVHRIDPALATDPDAKRTIIVALLKFIKNADDDVDDPHISTKALGLRFVKMLRRGGFRWPELDTIEKSLSAMPDLEI